MKTLRTPLVLVSLAFLVSCQKPVVVVVGPELGLAPLVRPLLAQGPGGPWTVTEEAQGWPRDAVVVRLTTTPGGNLSPGVPPAVSLPDTWSVGLGYQAPSALVRVARTAGGSWEAVPLFFDLWGQTRFKGSPTGLDWEALMKEARPQSVVVAGSRPAFRQWALLVGSPDPQARWKGLSAWFNQPPEGWDRELEALGGLRDRPLWVPDAWSLTPGDVRQSYLPGSPLVFLETFRDFEAANVSVDRRFFPFQKTLAQGFAVGGTVVFAEIRSSSAEDFKLVLPLLKVLVSPAFQGTVGSRTQWLGANLNSPELDTTGAAARGLTSQAQAFLPVTDRLPEPLVENNLLVQAQLSVDRSR